MKTAIIFNQYSGEFIKLIEEDFGDKTGRGLSRLAQSDCDDMNEEESGDSYTFKIVTKLPAELQS